LNSIDIPTRPLAEPGELFCSWVPREHLCEGLPLIGSGPGNRSYTCPFRAARLMEEAFWSQLPLPDLFTGAAVPSKLLWKRFRLRKHSLRIIIIVILSKTKTPMFF
jgi:hypothetical protein